MAANEMKIGLSEPANYLKLCVSIVFPKRKRVSANYLLPATRLTNFTRFCDAIVTPKRTIRELGISFADPDGRGALQ